MADINLGNYSPDDLILVVSLPDEVHLVGGYAEGTMVSVARNVQLSTYVSGGDDSGMRVFRKNDSGMITATLMLSSYTNDVFTRWAKKDIEQRGYLATVTFVDASGRSAFTGTDCYLENLPEATFGTDGTDTRVWVIQCRKLDQHIGGNSKLPQEAVATLESLGYAVPEQWRV